MSSDQELFSSLIRRLESATQRLEKYAQSQGGEPTAQAAPVPEAPATPVEIPPSVEAYDEFIAGAVRKYLDLSAQMGGPVNDQAQAMGQLADLQRALILSASQARKPSPTAPEFTNALQPMVECINRADELRNQNRADKETFNRLSAVAEGAGAFGWVTVERAPVPYVQDMKESAQFYGNRAMKAAKDAGEDLVVDWVKSYSAMLTDLADYVKAHHKTGLTWNPRGEELKDVKVAGTPAQAGGAPPPPPPPPPPPSAPPVAPTEASLAPVAPDMNAVFKQLNQGEAITSGLKKVDKSQMTHKNPNLRSGSPVRAKSAIAGKGKPAPPIPTKPRSLTKKPAPKFNLEGSRWVIENHESGELTVEITDMRQSVYIYNCQNLTVQIRGKLNAVAIDKCKKTGVVVETIISTVDVMNSTSFKFQITGRCPALLLDKCDGALVYLSKECGDIEITTAKTSEINISIEGATEDEDYKEHPVPEQLRTVIKNGKLVTVPVEHTG
ncbi:suppressor of rasval19 [Dimargaris cristalligena]|uniref:Adenylyl cyclase-associated protein n=1 Tax=Dimargaris cristalligena TaxID=215637 RepID=A0A4P9ZZE6_9FUNG|nr:suppressor of rasval19 [Dimargaris cristalligena]RKP39115.1 adenylate cyclase associated N terminal-domain-containing protein [Dimargaris cristalligena]|eukprot:RKP39115.1 adenylate cyclase associated N terminal-domain-containing protein [Dimargaris cristalligena]